MCIFIQYFCLDQEERTAEGGYIFSVSDNNRVVSLKLCFAVKARRSKKQQRGLVKAKGKLHFGFKNTEMHYATIHDYLPLRCTQCLNQSITKNQLIYGTTSNFHM